MLYRLGAGCLGAFFALITIYVLFRDVIGGAPVGIDHALSAAALLAALGSGHYLAPEWRKRHYLKAVGLALLFLGATAYVVVTSGARNSESLTAKADDIAEANRRRAALEQEITEAKALVRHARENRDKDCRANPDSTKCAGSKSVVTMGDSHVSLLEGKLKGLKPHTQEHSGYRHAAKVLIALGFGSDEQRTTDRLVLVLPYLVVVICEIGTIMFLGIAFAADPPAIPRAPAPSPARAAAPRRTSQARKGVIEELRAHADAHGRLTGTQRELAAAIKRPVASVNRALQDAAEDRRVSLSTDGRKTEVRFLN